MRLIDADALIEKWYEVNKIGPEDRGARFIGYTEIPRFINNAPTVQPTGDLISREDAIKAIDKQWLHNVNVPICGEIRSEIVQIISALPSADAVQETVPTVVRVTMSDGSQYYLEHERDAIQADAVQGEWIVREYCTNELDYRRWIEIECPFCGEKPTYENLDNMNFCPNCGARMTPYKGGDSE